MQSLSDLLTSLSLDPFHAARFSADATVGADDDSSSLAVLSAALNAAPPDGGAGDWAPCETCSDPGGDDDHNPYG